MRVALCSNLHGHISGHKSVLSYIEIEGGADILVAAGDTAWAADRSDTTGQNALSVKWLDALAAHMHAMFRLPRPYCARHSEDALLACERCGARCAVSLRRHRFPAHALVPFPFRVQVNAVAQ